MDIPLLPPVDLTELEASGKPGEVFEQLVREFLRLECLTAEFSGRGPDGGRDILATEELRGPITERDTRVWLVSCKNHARSDAAVAQPELPRDLGGKCQQYGATGFLLATTTTVTSHAKEYLDGYNQRNVLRVRYWIKSDIVRRLTENLDIFRRFLPNSCQRWEDRAANPNTVTEFQLQEIVSERYHVRLPPKHLRQLLGELNLWDVSKPEQIREIYQNREITEALNSLYRKLLGREVDPSGHLTWGLALQADGIDKGLPFVEYKIKNLPEYQAYMAALPYKDDSAG